MQRSSLWFVVGGVLCLALATVPLAGPDPIEVPPLVDRGSLDSSTRALLRALNAPGSEGGLGVDGHAALAHLVASGADLESLLGREAARLPTGPVTSLARGLRLQEALVSVGSERARALLLEQALGSDQLPPAGAHSAALRWLAGAPPDDALELLRSPLPAVRALGLAHAIGVRLDGQALGAVGQAARSESQDEALAALMLLGAVPDRGTAEERVDLILVALDEVALVDDQPDAKSGISERQMRYLAALLALGEAVGGEVALESVRTRGGMPAKAAHIALGLMGASSADPSEVIDLARHGDDLGVRLAAVEALHVLETPAATAALGDLAAVNLLQLATRHELGPPTWDPVQQAAARRR